MWCVRVDSKAFESGKITWVEETYHRRRRKRSLGKMTPVAYEAAFEALNKSLLVV